MEPKNKPDVRFEVITPAIALELLKSNTNNRPIKKHSVNLYLKQMMAGQFVVNGETIKFDSNGVLLDGQNRLIAISKMPDNYSYDAIVVRGLPPESFKTIDIGVGRTSGDIMYMAGHVKYSRLIPSMIRKHYHLFILENNISINGIVTYGWGENALTAADCIDIYERDKDLIDEIIAISNQGTAKTILTPVIAGSILLYLIRDKHYNIDVVRDFFNMLFSGANLLPDSSLLKIRNRLIKMRQRIIKINERESVNMVLKEFNKYSK